jgi:hypothetical protein
LVGEVGKTDIASKLSSDNVSVVSRGRGLRWNYMIVSMGADTYRFKINIPLAGEAEGANAGDSLPGEAIEKHVSDRCNHWC